MKPITAITAALALLSGAAALDIQKSVIISYPPETPDSVMTQAKKAVIDAGGIITHEYKMIKGFAAKVGEKVLETVSAMGAKYQVLVEEDVEVHAVGGL